MAAALIVASCVCAFSQDDAPANPPDLILINASIYNPHGRGIRAEALAIKDGKIRNLGSTQYISGTAGPQTKVIDAGGRMVLPGLIDSHIHFLEGCLTLDQVHLEDAKSLDEVLQRVRAYAKAHPEKRWILGRGWSYALFGPDKLPTRAMLDPAVSDRPVYLTGFDGHTRWANTKALEVAKITAKTADPKGGKIVRDAEGLPTGTLEEAPADALVRQAIPAPTRDEKLAALRQGLKLASSLGITMVEAAGGGGPDLSDWDNADLLDELRKSGELSVRFHLAQEIPPPALSDKQLQEIKTFSAQHNDDWINAGAAKFFLDGVIETHTAAMLEPYADSPGQSGQLFWDPEKYKQAVATLDKEGIQILTHAIGDRAVRLSLDAYENAEKVNDSAPEIRPVLASEAAKLPKDPNRRPLGQHRVEHIETIAASDIPRFGKLGVIASFQPLHAYPDNDTLDVWAKAVGPERAQRAWAWKSIWDGHGYIAFGSDWPVVSMNPFEGMQTAITRQPADGKPADAFVPEQKLSMQNTIFAYTSLAAYAGKRSFEGLLEPRMLGDFVILSQDLFKAAPSDIGKTQALLTVVDGRVVYQAPNTSFTPSAPPPAK
ncbi:MAG: amidohydrolase [Acidobacteriales bacterium]|nr:amidohydrolase [Terriglobales bacterium]